MLLTLDPDIMKIEQEIAKEYEVMTPTAKEMKALGVVRRYFDRIIKFMEYDQHHKPGLRTPSINEALMQYKQTRRVCGLSLRLANPEIQQELMRYARGTNQARLAQQRIRAQLEPLDSASEV